MTEVTTTPPDVEHTKIGLSLSQIVDAVETKIMNTLSSIKKSICYIHIWIKVSMWIKVMKNQIMFALPYRLYCKTAQEHIVSIYTLKILFFKILL